MKLLKEFFLKNYDKYLPVNNPDSGVLTPLEFDTALLVKAPHDGTAPTQAPIMLQIPSVNISCVASTEEVPPKQNKKKFQL